MTAQKIKRGSRESDERLLQWLDARAAGMSQATIARAYGANKGQVSRDGITPRMMADRAHAAGVIGDETHRRLG